MNWANSYTAYWQNYEQSFSWLDVSLYPKVLLSAGKMDTYLHWRSHSTLNGDSIGPMWIAVMGHFHGADKIFHHLGGMHINKRDSSLVLVYDQRAKHHSYGVITLDKYGKKLYLDNQADTTYWEIDIVDSQQQYYSVRASSFNTKEDIYFVADATHSSPDSMYTDIITYRVDHDGTHRWSRKFNTSTDSNRIVSGADIQADNTGNVYVAANSARDGILLKYDPDGDLLWELRMSDLGLLGSDYILKDIATDSAGNLVLAGKMIQIWNHALTVKVAPDGKVLWAKTLRTDNNDYEARVLNIDAQNNIFITGLVETSTGTATFAAKYNRHGRLLWRHLIAHGAYNEPMAMARDTAGNIIISGNSYNQDFESDIMTTKLKQTLHAAFMVEDEDCGRNLYFGNYSSAPKGEMQYLWDFGDGSTSIEENPIHRFDTGIYMVTLTTTDINGKQVTATETITVKAGAENSFTAADACIGALVVINNSSEAAGYSWDFGDGRSSIDKNPTLEYDSTGSYTIKLVVTGENGCTISKEQIVNIAPLPGAGFEVSPTGDRKYAFQADEQQHAKYTWSIDNQTLTGHSITHTFLKDGTYPVKLTVTSADSCSKEWDTMVVVKSTVIGEMEGGIKGVSVYPNPFEDKINLRFEKPLNADLNVTLIDITGKTILSQRIKATGSDMISVSTGDLKPGNYVLRLSNGVETREIVVTK